MNDLQLLAQAAYERNRQVYDTADVAEQYNSEVFEMGLFPAEQAILARLGERIRGKSVLDIGVGGGRTTPPLASTASRYIGIDYAEEMIGRCREKFRDVDFRNEDAKDLSRFDNDEFDVVWFSFNGIDYAFPDDRARIFAEVHRVLKPRGSFVFSSHNVNTSRWRPALCPELTFHWNLRRMISDNLSALRRYAASIYYYRRNRRLEFEGPGYAVRVDQAHEFRLLTYHAALRYQVEFLGARGFDDVEVVGLDGSLLPHDSESADAWLYYVARKSATVPAAPGPRSTVNFGAPDH